MCALCCAPSYTERPEICAEMCSEFALFQSCLLGHSCPLVRAPLQGHRYCPLAKSVRPSLTQIRFLPKWDFYCSIRAGSRISLPQPFPVSSRRGSAALLQFFFFFFPLLSSLLPLPHLPLGQIWNTDCKNVACVGQVLISKNEKSSLKKKRYPPFFGLLLHELPHKHRQQHPHWFCVLYSNVPPLSDQPCWCVCWCVVTCDPEAKLSHGASARSLFCYRRENSSLYAGSVGSYVWSA